MAAAASGSRARRCAACGGWRTSSREAGAPRRWRWRSSRRSADRTGRARASSSTAAIAARWAAWRSPWRRAANEDPAAREILCAAGVELARLATAMTKRYGPRPVALSGRVAELHPLIAESDARRLAARLPARASARARRARRRAHRAAPGARMTSSWMLVAGFLFAAMGVFVKLGAEHFGVAELAFYRSFVTLIVVVGMIAVDARHGRRARYLGTHVIRGIVGAVSLVGFFYAHRASCRSPRRRRSTTPRPSSSRSSRRWCWASASRPGSSFAIVLGFVRRGDAAAARPSARASKARRWWASSPGVHGVLGVPRRAHARAAWASPIRAWCSGSALIATLVCAAWQLTTDTFHAIRWDNWWILVGLGLCGHAGASSR